MDFTCPTCNVPLQAQTLDGIRLWKCATCKGFAISIPVVRKGIQSDTFKKFWQKLSKGETEQGRPCPGCKNPLSVVAAEGTGGSVMIDVCRTCHIIWFDDNEFSALPRVAPDVAPKAAPETVKAERPQSRVLTPEELAYAAFREDQFRRRSFLFKLLDGSYSKDLGLSDYFGDFFDGD